MTFRLAVCILLSLARADAQIVSFPYHETFDSLTVPALPPGWVTSSRRAASGDFTTTASTPSSPPNAVVGTNATIEQQLFSPPLDFGDATPESLFFMERRSSSHTSGLLIEAVDDTTSSGLILLSDTLRNSGTTAYVSRGVSLMPLRGRHAALRLCWHVLGNGSGTTGTIRFDDIFVTARLPVDLAVTSLSLVPPHPHAGGTFHAEATVTNIGTMESGNYQISFRADTSDGSGTPHAVYFYSPTSVGSLMPGDSTRFSAPDWTASSTPMRILARVAAAGDRVYANDSLADTLFPALPPRSIVINEIMYDPLPGRPEYLELYNCTANSIDLGGWTLADHRDTGTGGSGKLPQCVLAPHGFALLASDSSLRDQFPGAVAFGGPFIVRKSGIGLNNTGDEVVLLDNDGAQIDSLVYLPGWHNPAIEDPSGKSLERISPSLPSTDRRNWSTSAATGGGTPGAVNSLFSPAVPSSASLAVSPNPFSPDGDGVDDNALISYRVSFSGGVIRLRIYDSAGRLVRHLADNEPAGASGSVIWNGYDDAGRRVPIGIYILLFEAAHPLTGRSETSRTAVVVAARL